MTADASRPRGRAGPRGYPLVGNLPQLARDPLAFCTRVNEEFGDRVRLRLGPKTAFLVSHPRDVRYVLQDKSKNFGKGRMWQAVKKVFGEGLATSEGPLWLRQRRLMQPAFHRDRIAALVPLMGEVVARKVEEWARAPGPIDVVAEMMALTGEASLRTLFSSSLRKEDLGAMTEALAVLRKALNRVMWTSVFPDGFPLPGRSATRAAFGVLEALLARMIEERKGGGPSDLLSLLLDARDADTGEAMSQAQLRDEVVTLFFAGQETTAFTLCWVFYALAHEPGILDGVFAEVGTIGETIPSMNALKELDFTRRVIEETQRFYPPGWVIPREATTDDALGDMPVPADALILVCPYLTDRHPEFWENPLKFDPEHFTADRVAARDSFAFYPFGRGPRQCIGNGFAMMETLLVTAMAARRFRMELTAPVTQKTVAVQVHPHPKLLLRFTERSAS